jgi:uncharacterized membrane protein
MTPLVFIYLIAAICALAIGATIFIRQKGMPAHKLLGRGWVGLEDMSYAETAEILEIPVGTLMSRLAQGRERLKKIMDCQEPILWSLQ